ncbi:MULTISPECIES: ScbA/BarX family gamma-butyrolactone biosynthesis protein [Streptomyces]|uniref:ScbA/BarX family gamma-butyrolactone biosynthesis protein n=1 Tax=Streptomyces TaxID=1883 RepID=UPI0009973E23|nr:ScbA/BarX family gamma-butyrolactone biosynthesis protein [Streptomyces sp. NRRL F-2305]
MTSSAMASQTRGLYKGASYALFPQVKAVRPPVAPTPVARELVHRAQAHDVLPTKLTRHDDTNFTVSARLPHRHRLFTTTDGRYTASYVLEAIRQTTLLVSHAELGVPLGHHFVMWDMGHRLDTELPTLDTPSEGLTLDVEVTDLRRRGAVPSAVALEMTIRAAGRAVGTGSIRFNITSPAAYTRIRGSLPTTGAPDLAAALPAPMDPPTVHHTRACDVVLAAPDRTGRWQLRADPANTLFFDRVNDHIPAMVLVEAAQQAAGLTVPPGRFVPSSSRMNFSRYVELDQPCWIEAHQDTAEDGTTSVRVTGHQNERLAFTIEFADTAAR